MHFKIWYIISLFNYKSYSIELIRTELIERMQRHVHKDLQRTLNGNPDCLDEPGIV